MTTTPKALIGACVQFVSNDVKAREVANGCGVHAAIITCVHPDGKVNLKVLFDGAAPDRHIANLYAEGDDPANPSRGWRWPQA